MRPHGAGRLCGPVSGKDQPFITTNGLDSSRELLAPAWQEGYKPESSPQL